METSSIVIIVIAAIIVFWLYNTYTKVIKANNMAQAALSSIEIQLRKRYDLIPNVLAIAKKFMTHEKETLAEITSTKF
jgi:LemA protein